MPDQNPIYDFLKSNKLTDLDEKSFVSKYAAPENAKEIYSFFVENKLTDLDSAGFYDKYLKKKVGGEISSPTESKLPSREYLSEGQELAEKGFIKTEKLDPSQLVSQYKSPDISLTPKPKKDYYSSKLEKGLIFDKEGKLFAPSSEALTKDITAAEEIDLKKSTQKDLVEKSREMPVEEETAPIEKQGWLLNTVSALDKGFAKNFISSPIKGLGTVLQGVTKKVLGGTGEGYVSNALIKYGDYLNNAIDELTPQDEEFKGTLLDQAAQALGQVGSLVFTGGLAGAGKGATAALVSEVPKGAVATATKALGSQLASPTAVSAGLSMGQAEFDRAKEAGATDDQAFEAFYKNAATGSVLETIPVMQFFKRFNNSTGGSVANYIKTKGVAGLTGGIEEMTTEVMQQLYSNKTAKDIYNINQDILDGVGSSGGVGFGVGFLLNAMGANAKILRKQGREQEATVLENQVKQYENNLENPKITSDKKAVTKDIITQGVEIGTQKAVKNLDRDLANNVITPEQHQEGIIFAEKAAQVADKIPQTVTGESRAKSIELLVERNDINQANQNLIQQKQTTDVAYHAGIDEEIKANEERIKKIDSEVYNIAKKPSKEFGDKKYVVDGEEVSKEEFEALQGKPMGTKTVIKAEVKPAEEVKVVTEEVKPTEVKVTEEIKPTEVKIEDVTSKQKNEKFDAPTLKSPASNYEKLYVPRNVLEQAYKNDKDNNPVFGKGNQPLNRIIERGGYSIEELDKLYPNWKESKTEVKPTEVKEKEPINIRKELTSQIDKKEIELIEKQQSDIDKAKADLKEIQNDNQEVISEYVKKSGYKLITKNTINPASKMGEKFPESDIGKYYKFTGSSLIRNTAKNLALKGAEAKAKSTAQGSRAGMNKYNNAFGAVKDYENGNITKIQLLKTIKDSGLDIEKFDIKKPIEVKAEVKPTEVKQPTKEAKGKPELAPVEPKKTYQEAVKEKLEADKKRVREAGAEKAIVTKEIYRRVDQMDDPSDAEQIALRYLADGGKVSKEAVDEAYGRVKRAELNVKRRVLLSEEVKSKDYVQGSETLDDLAHRLWEVNKQKIPEDKIKDKLMSEIGNNNTRLDAAEAYLDKYNAEYKQEKEELRLAEQYKEQYLEEQAEIEKELRKPLDEQIEGEATEEHINNLIKQYEAEIKGEDQQPRPESEGDASKEAGKRKVAEKTSETELAKEYKEVVGKASKKAKENAKKEFVDRNFENIVEKLKIQIKCPT